MPRQQIIWTALPNGFNGEGRSRKLKLSVFVAPRLRFDGGQETGSLEAFPDFLDWPARLNAGVEFTVIVDPLQQDPRVSVPSAIVTAHSPDSALWKAVFDQDTLVRARKFEGVREPFASPPASTLAAGLSDGYGKIACESPYRPSSGAALKEAFPQVSDAVRRTRATTGPQMADRLRGVGTLDPRLLDETHRELGANLLRHDPGLSFDDKIEAATTIAGRLARADGSRPVPIVPRTGKASATAEFVAFHSRPPRPARRAVEPAPLRRAREIETMDFHQMLSALGEYPELLRRLGLVIDLEVSGELPPSLPGRLRRIRVEPAFTPAAPADEAYLPATKYLHDVRTSGSLLPFPVFAAAPRGAETMTPGSPAGGLEIVGGLLNLRVPAEDDPRALQYDVIQVDVDGAMKKLVNALQAMARDEERPDRPIDTVKDAAAPAFRTTGVSLVRAGRAKELLDAVTRSGEQDAAMQRGEIADFYAEDLVRGYRIDVRRFGPDFQPGSAALPPWMSLHERIGSFSFKRPGSNDADAVKLTGITDEGFVQPALVQDVPDPAAPARPNPVYIHESLFHWQGWSLSSPPPVTPMDLDPAGPPTRRAPAAGPMAIDFEPAPRSLPRLRFGSHYQLRARTVDLAGNGLSVAGANQVLDALAQHHTLPPIFPLGHQEFLYQRYEPLVAPTLVLCERLTEGEAVDVMVIRSNGPSMSPAEYAASLRDSRYRGVNERHIVPPKTAQVAAETHGLLDGAFGAAGDPVKHFNICRRESGSLNDAFVTNLETGEREPLANVVRVDPVTGATATIANGILFVPLDQATPPPVTPQVEPRDGYTVHYEDQLRLPYLPDPVVRGAALFGLPGVFNDTIHLDERGELVHSGSERQVLPHEAIVALGFVTKIHFGRRDAWPEQRPFKLRLDGAPAGASAPTPEWTEQRARVLTVRLPPGTTKDVWVSSYPDRADVGVLGLHQWAKKWFEKNIGVAAGERHFLNLAQHGALSLLSPARRITLVHAVQQPLTAPAIDPAARFTVDRLKDNDTVAYVHGTVTIHAPSTAKLDLQATWTERGTEAGDDSRTVNTHVFEIPIHEPPVGADADSDPVPIAAFVTDVGDMRVKFLSPPSPDAARAKRWLAHHEFGDTRHRKVTYELVATTRFREYFPAHITEREENLTRKTMISQVMVRSSARPPAPTVTRVVPTFKWNESLAGLDVVESKRRGGGLRVYLGDRWHASGEDEQLAVVEPVESGADPLHLAKTAADANQVRPNGTSAVDVASESGTFRIHPYPVLYDKTLKQWYCDITFDVTGLYFPFIRLALARYQQHSLHNLHLSPIVHAGIYQLASDRWVKLEHVEVAGQRSVTITVCGKDAAALQPPLSSNIGQAIDVSLQERQGSPPDPDLGWTAGSAAHQPIADAAPLPQGVLWHGAVILPDPVEGTDLRLLVREFEVFEPVNAVPGQRWIGDADGAPARRLVYADTIPL